MSMTTGSAVHASEEFANDYERKPKSVPTNLKTPSNSLRAARQSRSKTRSEKKKAIGRVSISSDQIPTQTYTQKQLLLHESCRAPLSQIRSYSPPEREYPETNNLPLRATEQLSQDDHLTQLSTGAGVTAVLDIKPQMCGRLGGTFNLVDRSSFDFARADVAKSSSEVSHIDTCLMKFKEGILTHFGNLPNVVPFHGRAHSWDNLSINYENLVLQDEISVPNVPDISNKTGSRKERTFDQDTGAYEAELKSLREQLALRSQELQAVKKEGASTESRLRDSVYMESVNEDTFNKLKNKIGELYADLESLRCAHTQALDRQIDLQEQITELRRSCDWYAEQLKLTQCSRDKFACENERLQSLLRESGEHNHRLTHENNCLQAQLACAQAASATAKRNLSAQLDAIRVDMIEREALFERFTSERASLEKINAERTSEVSSLQLEIRNLQRELGLANEQITRQRDGLEHLESYLSSSDAKQTELESRLLEIEHTRATEDQKTEEQQLSYSLALERLEEMQKANEEKDKALSTMAEEKAWLESELNAACREKNTLNEYLDQLKDNLVRIEESFDRARCELDSKQIQLLELTDERDILQNKINKLNQQLVTAVKTRKEKSTSVENNDFPMESLNDGQNAGQRETHTDPQLLVTRYSHEFDSETPLDSAVITVHSNHPTPNASGAQLSEASIEKTELFASAQVLQHVELHDLSNSPHSYIKNQQIHHRTTPSEDAIPPLENQITTVPPEMREQQRIMDSGSAIEATEALSNFRVQQPHSNGTSIPPDQSSFAFGFPENGRQWCNESSGRSIQDTWEFPLSDHLIPESQKVGGLWTSSDKPMEQKLSQKSVPSDVTGRGGSSINDCVRINLCPEEPIILPQPQSNLVCSGNVTPDNAPCCPRQENAVVADNMRSLVDFESPTPTVDYVGSDEFASPAHPHVAPKLLGDDACDVQSECAVFPIDALKIQFSSVQSESVHPKADCFSPATEDEEPVSRWTPTGSTLLTRRVMQVGKHPQLTSVPYAPETSGQRTDNPNGNSEFKHTLQPVDSIGVAGAPFKTPTVYEDSSESTSVAVDNCGSDREMISKALSDANRRAAEAVSDLVAVRREVDEQKAAVEREILARQQASKAHQQAVAELNLTRSKLDILQAELKLLRKEMRELRAESDLLRERQTSSAQVHTNEINILRTVIKTTTDHLTLVSTSLKAANEEKTQLQRELAHIKSHIQTQLAKFRLFSRTGSVDSHELSIGEQNQSVISLLASIGLDVEDLEGLVGERISLPALNSKPLTGLNKCFDALQAEISSLENEIIHHATALQESMSGPMSTIEDGAIRTDKDPATFCDWEP